MSVPNHVHEDDIIVDADVHFTIDTTTRAISSGENKKLTLMQYDNKSERYSFDVDRIIDGHDLTLCNRVQIHFINIGSNKQKHPGLYLVDDVHVNTDDDEKLTFTWLISQDATSLSGILSFLVSFECVDGETVLYRWSSNIFNQIQIVSGMDNDNTIFELYADELLAWQNSMENDYIPDLVDRCYIEKVFATSEEVEDIFAAPDLGDLVVVEIDNTPIDNSPNLITSGGVKKYIDSKVLVLDTRVSNLESNIDNAPTENSENLVTSGGVKTYVDTAIQSAISSTLGGDY